MYLESVFCFPIIVGKVLGIQERMNLFVSLVVVCRPAHLLLLRKRFELVV